MCPRPFGSARPAIEADLDISGTLFRTGGEPLTPSRAEIVAETGSRVVCNYGIAEAGRLGLACGAPEQLDDVHLLTDKIAVVQRPTAPFQGGPEFEALWVTTLVSRRAEADARCRDRGLRRALDPPLRVRPGPGRLR